MLFLIVHFTLVCSAAGPALDYFLIIFRSACVTMYLGASEGCMEGFLRGILKIKHISSSIFFSDLPHDTYAFAIEMS